MTTTSDNLLNRTPTFLPFPRHTVLLVDMKPATMKTAFLSLKKSNVEIAEITIIGFVLIMYTFNSCHTKKHVFAAKFLMKPSQWD